MTTVKIQKPVSKVALETHEYMIYDKYKARTSFSSEKALPVSVRKCFDLPPGFRGRYVQYFDGAIWDHDNQIWLLDNVKPVAGSRRLSW